MLRLGGAPRPGSLPEQPRVCESAPARRSLGQACFYHVPGVETCRLKLGFAAGTEEARVEGWSASVWLGTLTVAGLQEKGAGGVDRAHRCGGGRGRRQVPRESPRLLWDRRSPLLTGLGTHPGPPDGELKSRRASPAGRTSTRMPPAPSSPSALLPGALVCPVPKALLQLRGLQHHPFREAFPHRPPRLAPRGFLALLDSTYILPFPLGVETGICISCAPVPVTARGGRGPILVE